MAGSMTKQCIYCGKALEGDGWLLINREGHFCHRCYDTLPIPATYQSIKESFMSVSPSSRYAGAFQVVYKTFANNPVSTVTILADSEEKAKAIFTGQHEGDATQPIIVAVSATVITF